MVLSRDTVAISETNVREEHEIYEEILLTDMEWDDDEQLYLYDCPCGDVFTLSKDELSAGQLVLVCPTCSLAVRVLLEKN